MGGNFKSPRRCTILCNDKFYEEVNSESYARHLARTKSLSYPGEEWSVEFYAPGYNHITYVNGAIKL